MQHQNAIIGDESELRFMAQAVARGLIVSKPFNESSPYDCIVDNGDERHRVQVKGTASHHSTAPNRFDVGIGTGYSTQKTDFVAIHIQPLDVWYIIPVADINGITKITLRPQADNISRFSQYEEAWYLLQ